MGFLKKVGTINFRTMLKRKLSKKSSIKSEEAEIPPKTSRAGPSQTAPNTLPHSDFTQKFINIQLELNSALKPLKFKSPVEYIYNPVEYAFKPNETYVKKYCQGPKKILFVGMNPGPFGMCQTGVPFGEIKSVREWLDIEEEVSKPEKECPGRPVVGFACTKSEVSGTRLWNLIKKISGTPEIFFKNCFVYNYCPLALLNKTGGNVTPSDIKTDAKILEEVCDKYFFQIIQHLEPEIIIGIGRYAENRALTTLKNNSSNIRVIFMTHPSPRVPNSKNWATKAEEFFQKEDLLKYMTN